MPGISVDTMRFILGLVLLCYFNSIIFFVWTKLPEWIE